MSSKRILVSKNISSQIEEWQENDGFCYGLVLGHFSGKELMVVHLARTPPEESEAEAESEGKGPKSLSEIDPGWVGEHVKQVRSMLPGGMEVQGLFFVTEEDIFQGKNEAKVTGCLKKLKEYMNMEEPALWPIFHVRQKSTQVKVISLADPHKSKMSSFEESDMQWLCLKANLILDQPLAFTEEKTNCPLKEKLDAAVKKMEFALEKAQFLIGGQFRSSSAQICQPPAAASTKSGKKSGKKEHIKEETTTTDASCDEYDGTMGNKRVKEFDVDILFGESCSNLDDCIVSDVNSRMHITGRMCARAFVHRYATVEQAINALKMDILRTFQARLEMHCDSLAGDEIQGDETPILHEPPRRVNIKLPYTAITVSDFLFPGETRGESVKAVEEMLGFTPNFEHLDDELEIVASPQHIRMEDESRAESPVLEKRAPSNHCSPIHIILSILVAMAAIFASYLMVMSDEAQEDEVVVDETTEFDDEF